MVFPFGLIKRLFSRKRKTTKAPRRTKKRVSRKPATNGAIQIKRIVQYDRDYVSSNVYEPGNYTFELADMPNYSAYVGLYEYFRIDKVTVQFRAQNTHAQQAFQQPVGNSPLITLGRIHTVIDYNDAVNYPATRAGIQSMMIDNTYKCTSSNRNHSRTFVPRILMEAGGSSVGAVSKAKQWIPTGASTLSLSHYCLKWMLEGGDGVATHASFMIEPTVTMWVSFKDIKSQ